MQMTMAAGTKGRFLRLTGPKARGFLSLTGLWPEGCGIARRAMSFIMPPAAVTSTSSIIIRVTTVHPFATLWPSSPKGDARSVTGLAVCVICDTISSATYFSFPLEGKSREAGKGVRGRAPIRMLHRGPDRQSAAP